jgi:putative phosphoesterase
MKAGNHRRKNVHVMESISLQECPGDLLRIACVADTHSNPHPELGTRLRELAPSRIFHAGDIGNLDVLRALREIAPVIAVRGNIDGLEQPDVVTVNIKGATGTLLRILITHIAVNGPKLRADVLRLARSQDAGIVVCGHSHVPFAAHDRGVTVMNPGSVGPRRFQLPIVLGVIDVRADGVSLRHVDCETGEPWRPGAMPS